MKVTLKYGNKSYGNRKHSKATKVAVYNSGARISIEFLEHQTGRSWDWLNAGSVGGAEIELSPKDAQALARLLLDVAEASAKVDKEYDAMDIERPNPYGLLKLRDGHAPEAEVRDREVDGD